MIINCTFSPTIFLHFALFNRMGNAKVARIDFAWYAIISYSDSSPTFGRYTKIVLVIPMGIVIEGM